ncbi:lipase family alpha/beta hydrolase [Nocardioides litoris]|uniref:lipase family alpha/beta hydrolase n=1 Tax=Nocardioides litoris TaxID=1926648 RepID=UPI001B85EF40|nr:alpha/beta fold hydrolase [Nocardioides litoris]
MRDTWSSLAPARRRVLVGAVGLLLVVVVAVVVVALVRRDDPVDPVAQDRPGPVLLVPGYGGSTAGLEVLADALRTSGRDARVVAPAGDGTGDLEDQAADLAAAVDRVLGETGAPSVDLVGYSAGGVVVRLYVADLGGGSTVRRAVSLGSPQHGTDLTSLGAALGGATCPEACRQLDPGSTLLRELNAGDETPPGPAWVAVWTEGDATVVPADSGALAGATSYAVQEVCPDLAVSHTELPRDPAVAGMVEAALAGAEPAVPGPGVC